ncbi:Transcriptional regulator, IclR family [hydrothermal vent metagenome]|uniref:Transcriptional regulator, IclR family n=1 Tax=hydrothermal vent metagenome TaxID=652676 RepID=A0A3B0UWD5_9ZZZZ
MQALDRGLMLLVALTREGSVTLTDIALKVGMPPSSAHRVLITLQKHGFVEFNETTQEWAIGIEAFRVGNSYLERTNLVEMAQQVMRNLMEDTGETANLAIGSDGQVVFVSQVETHNPIRAFFRPGTRGHMHASGIGKALLADMSQTEVEKTLQKTGLPEFTSNTLVSPDALFADLKKIANRRWSFDDEERYLGMRCVAASIYNSSGKAIAGISVSGPTIRFADIEVDEIGPRVRRAADEITLMTGGKIP